MSRLPLRTVSTVLAATLVVASLGSGAAQARAGGGVSSGSRGSSTFSRPPSTPTAPRSAEPMARTEMPSAAPRPNYGSAATPARSGLGFGSGLLTGLLGAGLIGALFGGSVFGGLGSFASLLGLLLQVGLVVGLVALALRIFRRRSEPAFAGAPGVGASFRTASDPRGFGTGGGATPARQPVTVTPADFDGFERALTAVQLAYGRGDTATLRRLATPEMAGYLANDLAADRARGVRNEVREPKLLQGDLAEAWREENAEYATVAMRFSLIDVTVELANSRVVAGHPDVATEATELWTFRREPGGSWLLSAIQQAA